MTGILLISLYQLGTVRKRSALTAIVGRGGGTALTFDAAIRSFLSEAKTLKWSQKQNDCHYCDRYVNGTPHFSSRYSPR